MRVELQMTLKISGILAIALSLAIFLAGRASMVISSSQPQTAWQCYSRNEVYLSTSPDGRKAVELIDEEKLINGYRTNETTAYWFEASTKKRGPVLFVFSETPLLSIQWANNTIFLYGIHGLDEVNDKAMEIYGLDVRLAEETPSDLDSEAKRLTGSSRGYEISHYSCGAWCFVKQIFSNC
jgi:hypothetical protein